jgi:hypothetical protein
VLSVLGCHHNWRAIYVLIVVWARAFLERRPKMDTVQGEYRDRTLDPVKLFRAGSSTGRAV